MDLVEFLLARIAEDEATTRVMRNRILAECEAKRRIVEHHERWARTLTESSGRYTDDQCTMYRMAMCWVLEQLALPYADHPDYQELS